MFTKTQIKILEVFVSKITDRFSIKQISETIKKPYPLVHRSIKPLIQDRFIIKDNRELLSLNYKENISFLSYIEAERAKEFLKKDKTIDLFYKDCREQLKDDFFILLVFGSSVEKNDPKDIDILMIIENQEKIDLLERQLINIIENFSKKFDINVISIKSAYQMLQKRDEINILNESLNNHMILFGAENLYRILKNAR